MLTASSAGVSAPIGEADRRVDARDRLVAEAGLAQRRLHARPLGAAGHDADVAGAEAQRLLQHVEVVHVPASDDDHVGALVHADGRERVLERPRDDARVGEPRGRRELLAVVDDDHTEAQTREQRRDLGADVPGAADHGQRRRLDALEHGRPAVRQRRHAVQGGHRGEAAQRRRVAHGGAGDGAVLVQRAVLDGRRVVAERRGDVPGAPPGVARRAQRRADGEQLGVTRRHVRDEHLGGAAADHLVAAGEVRAAQVRAGAARAALRERPGGGLHHAVLDQAAADGAGDRPVLAHQHLRAGRARRGALVGDQRDQGERPPGLQQLQRLFEDLVHRSLDCTGDVPTL